MSRAQRYVIGAAIAATMVGASCGPGESTTNTSESNGNQVTQTTSGGETAGGSADAGAAEDQNANQNTFNRQNVQRTCDPVAGCPPYGCVFPDDACDVVSA
jgi:hypothetical protein